MMPSLAEIVFNCPLCQGPLIAWETDAGRATDCPHCLKPITVPSNKLEKIDKSTYCEPHGLRRILQEVRDSEWEAIRRKLQESRTKVAALEAELRAVRAQGGVASPGATGSAADYQALRQELEAVSTRFAESTKTLSLARQQHEIALDRLHEQLEILREEVEPLREEHSELVQQLSGAREELEQERQVANSLRQELEARKARSRARMTLGIGPAVECA